MKIGLVCPYNIERNGGVLEVILALKTGLEERGHAVKIITPYPRNHDIKPNDDVIFAGTSTDFRTLSFSTTTSQVSSTADNDEIDAMLAAEKFDILHFHEPWMPLLSRQLLQRSTSVNIGTFHAKVTEAMISRTIIKVVTPYLKSCMKYLHELTAVSASAAEYVSGMTDQSITLIPNGINLAKYQAIKHIKSSDDTKTILFIGRLERRKGVQYLLRAYGRLVQEVPDIKLIIAGDGPDREKLELMAEDLKLDNVSFLGYVSEDVKLELLAKADLLCSPAVFGESFGIVLLEAMASGVVCVVGNNSGYVDLLQDVGAISLVNPHDTEEFARRLDTLLLQEPLRQVWRKWAKDYVKRFNYPNVVARYEEFYQEALKRHGQGR